MKVYSGTSGFAYREWRGSFYPPTLAPAGMLSYYAGRLPAVEINATFYRMPRGETLAGWAGQVPQDFRFAFKVPAVITHRRQLRAVDGPLRLFLERTSLLGARRGPLLFQLPPYLACDLSLLTDVLPLLCGVAAAFEFRHPSWFHDKVYQALSDSGCALCISDRDEAAPPPVVATAPFGYLRLRRGDYSREALARWLDIATSCHWHEVFCFFRHEETGSGPRLAQDLLGLLPADHSALPVTVSPR